MTRTRAASLAVLILVCAPASAQETTNVAEPGVRFSAGAAVGYYSGFGVEFSGTFSEFARGFPLAIRAGVGYASVDPGSAPEARKIFINNATNGAPEKSGRVLDLRFDAMYRLTGEASTPAYFYAGPRYASFKGNFKYVGGNEDFDVTSGQWGLGLGLEGHFGMGRSGMLVVGGGADYYFADKLQGHDTWYTPSGDDANPRKEYTFTDADAAINQPQWVPRFMVGFRYAF